MPSWKIPTPFRYYTAGQAVVSVNGQTVDAALADLINQYPNLKTHLFKGTGELRAFVNIFVGEDNIKNLLGLETAVGEYDELRLVPSISGG